ncbi:phage capsid protein, partial [Streptomyces sp. A73]|nr:phage capsid protein [Streptomyces sp. A73]
TDAAVKLVQAGILPAEGEVVLEMAGLSEAQRQRVAAERRRAQGRQVLDRLTQLGAEDQADEEPEEPDGGDD